VQGKAAAWECLELKIPRAELSRNTELFTQVSGPETLVTRFGQLVILCLVAPTVAPPASAELTVWLDVNWRFYEPNASSASLQETPVFFSAGNWNVTGPGVIQPFGGVGGLTSLVAYRCYPSMLGELFSDGQETPFIGMHGSTPNGFLTADHAIDYAVNGTGTFVRGGSNTAFALPSTICYPLTTDNSLADRIMGLTFGDKTGRNSALLDP